MIADLEDLEKLDASDIYPRRINAKEVLITPEGDEFMFPCADGTAKLSGRDYEFREPPQRREPTVRSEDFSRELQGESGASQPAESIDDVEARADFWSIQGDFTYRHHNEPRDQLYVPKEEPFPIALKYIDVTRSLALIWTSCKRNVPMTFGMSIRTGACQIRGKVSQSSLD